MKIQIVGVPGEGKTTLARLLARALKRLDVPYTLVDADDEEEEHKARRDSDEMTARVLKRATIEIVVVHTANRLRIVKDEAGAIDRENALLRAALERIASADEWSGGVWFRGVAKAALNSVRSEVSR